MIRGLNRISVISVRKSSEIVGAGTSTGIEHSLKQREIGSKHKQDFKDYKCIDYLNFNKYSFYDKEENLQSFRVPQPSNTKPDLEPKFKTSA